GLYCNLIHASQPIRTTFTGQWFASSFLQTPPHDDALAFGCTLPTAGRVRDFHPLERVPAGHTTKRVSNSICLDTLLVFVCYKGRVRRLFKFHWIEVSFESFLILLSKYSLESDWILLFGCTLSIPSIALLKSLLFAR